MTVLTSLPPIRSTDVWHQASWSHALEAFCIPFLCYGPDGARTYMSSAADALLRSSRVGQLLGAQADNVAKELSWSRPFARAGHLALVREIPGWSDGVVLAVYVTGSAGGRAGVVVIVRAAIDLADHEMPVHGLTPREADVARLVAAGLPTKTIAFRLGISAHTARHHTERVFDKLGVHTRAALAALLAGREVDAQRTASPVIAGGY